MSQVGNGVAAGGARMPSAFKSYLGSAVHKSGKEMALFSVGFGKITTKSGLQKFKFGKGGGLLGLAFTGYSMYQGYEEGGAWGAVKGGAGSVAENYAFGAVSKALHLGGVGIGAAVVLGTAANIAGNAALGEIAGPGSLPLSALVGGPIGFAANAMSNRIFPPLARSAVASHMHRHAELEMGRPVIDEFGTLATMRQRSMMAIQNSKINGRCGLGNESTYTFRPYFR